MRGPGRAIKALLTAAFCVTVSLAGVRSVQDERAAGASRPAQGPTTTVLLTALGKDKSVVKTLAREDLRVVSDGVPREIVGFEPQTDSPLRLALMLDTSASQENVLPAAKSAAGAFISEALRPDKDLAAVVGFTHEAEVIQGLTGDAEQLRRAVESVRFTPPSRYIGGGIVVAGRPPSRRSGPAVPGSTALWDSLLSVCEKVLAGPRDGGRRAVLLISDGVDTSSQLKLDKVIERAVRAGVVVYSVGVADRENFDPPDKDVLRKISERTGGRAYFPEKLGDLPAVFEKIRQELLSQYAVTFNAPDKTGDSFHKLRVEIVNPELRKQELRLAYPHGYFAGNTKN